MEEMFEDVKKHLLACAGKFQLVTCDSHQQASDVAACFLSHMGEYDHVRVLVEVDRNNVWVMSRRAPTLMERYLESTKRLEKTND